MEQLEQDGVKVLEPTLDDVFSTNQKEHLFASHQALCDFALVFKIDNYNVRRGYAPGGKLVYQLVYESHNN